MIRALTIHQPWAWLISIGLKDVENRVWPVPRAFVGQHIAIHAAKAFNENEVRGALAALAAADVIADSPAISLEGLRVQSSHIIAIAKITGCVRESSSKWFQGPYGWTLDDVCGIEPVSAKGALGLWTLAEEMEIRVRSRWSKARGERRRS